MRRGRHGVPLIIPRLLLAKELNVLRDEVAWLYPDMIWPTIFAVGAVAFVTLRTLKKTTTLFSVDPPADGD